jgi:hypothetical protein
MTQEQINKTFETDRLTGLPQGMSLAQIKQESQFNPNAKSHTGAVGLTQFTGVAIADVLMSRGILKAKPYKDLNGDERAIVEHWRRRIATDRDTALAFHREYMLTMKKRHGRGGVEAILRNYNGASAREQAGYIRGISKYAGGVAPGHTVAQQQSTQRKESGSNTTNNVAQNNVNVSNTTVTPKGRPSGSNPRNAAYGIPRSAIAG